MHFTKIKKWIKYRFSKVGKWSKNRVFMVCFLHLCGLFRQFYKCSNLQQHIPYSDDVADGSCENEEMEDAVHVSLLV